MIKEENSKGPYDITFMEGSVVCEEDLERLKQIREKTKILVAFGTCACTGNVQTMKNIMDPLEVEKAVYKKRKHLKSITPTPLHTHVKIDYALSGCPPDKMEILRIIKDFLNGKKPAVYENPVCVECIKKENYCLLEQDKSCLGPVTRGGCDALCPSINHGCTGCHGLSEDCHLNPLEELLKKKDLQSKK